MAGRGIRRVPRPGATNSAVLPFDGLVSPATGGRVSPPHPGLAGAAVHRRHRGHCRRLVLSRSAIRRKPERDKPRPWSRHVRRRHRRRPTRTQRNRPCHRTTAGIRRSAIRRVRPPSQALPAGVGGCRRGNPSSRPRCGSSVRSGSALRRRHRMPTTHRTGAGDAPAHRRHRSAVRHLELGPQAGADRTKRRQGGTGLPGGR